MKNNKFDIGDVVVSVHAKEGQIKDEYVIYSIDKDRHGRYFYELKFGNKNGWYHEDHFELSKKHNREEKLKELLD